MKRYCPSCGKGTDYTVVKPTKCSGCNKSYDGIVPTPPRSVNIPRPPAHIETPEENEEFDDAPRETNLDIEAAARSFGFDIRVAPNARAGIKARDLAMLPPNTEKRDRPPVNVNDVLDSMLPFRNGGGKPGTQHAAAVEVRQTAVTPKAPRAPRKAVAKRKAK